MPPPPSRPVPSDPLACVLHLYLIFSPRHKRRLVFAVAVVMAVFIIPDIVIHIVFVKSLFLKYLRI